MEFFDKLKEKIQGSVDVQKQGGEKQRLKEDYFNNRMTDIQNILQSEEKKLNYRQKFDLLLYMKVYMNDQETIEVQKMKKMFSNATYYSTIFAFSSVIAVACIFRSYQKLNSFSKFLVCFSTFSATHYVSMYGIQMEGEQLCDKIINKYQDNFLNSQFVTGKLNQEQLQAANTILMPTTNMVYQIEQKKQEKQDQQQQQNQK